MPWRQIAKEWLKFNFVQEVCYRGRFIFSTRFRNLHYGDTDSLLRLFVFLL